MYISKAGPPRAVRLFLLLALSVGAATTARAHTPQASNVNVVLGPIPQVLRDVRIQLLNTLAPQLIVENRSDKTVEVEDEAGNPAIRIGPKGVELNMAAPLAYRSPQPASEAINPGPQPPQWVTISPQPSWGWFDPHLRTAAVRVPEKIAHGRRAATIGKWQIAMRYGNTPVTLRGRFEFVPPARGVIVPRLTSAAQPAPQIAVMVLPGPVPGILVQNGSEQAVSVLDDAGQAFLKIGPGNVTADVHSAAWMRSGRAAAMDSDKPRSNANGTADTITPTANSPGDNSQWQTVSSGSSFVWLEPRAAYQRSSPPDKIVTRGQQYKLKSWQVPIRIGDQSATIGGETWWIPSSATHGNR